VTTVKDHLDELKAANTVLRRENARLKQDLAETQDVLEAIQTGAVDAFVVSREGKSQVFTLEGAERPFRTVVETMNEGTATVTDDGLILYCNQRFSDILHVPAQNILGRNMDDFLNAEDQLNFKQMVRQAHQESIRGELNLTAAEGRQVPVYAAFSPLENSDVQSVSVIVTDISDLKRKSKELVGEALRAGRVIAFEWDCDTDKITRSENAADLFGHEASTDTGAAYTAMLHYDDRQRFVRTLCSIKDTGGHYRQQYRLFLPGGQMKWVEDSAEAIVDDHGTVIRISGLIVDITEQKYTEESLRRAQSVAKVGSWLINIRTGEIKWSKETYRIFAVPAGTSLTYESVIEMVHPEDRPAVEIAWQIALLSKTDYNVRHRITVNGQTKWIQEIAELEFAPDGALIGAFGTAQDITDIKNTEDQLRKRTAEAEESKRLLEAIMEHIPVGLAVIDAVRKTTRLISRVGADQLNRGYRASSEQLEPWMQWDLRFGDGKTVSLEEMPLYRALYDDQTIESEEYLAQLEDRTYVHLLISAGPVRDSRGKVIAAIALWQDITELKEAEQRLQQRTAEAEEGKRLLDAIMEYIPVGLTILDRNESRVRAISRSALKLLGREISEIDTLRLDQIAEFWQVLLPEDGAIPSDELPIIEAIQEGRTIKERELVVMSKQQDRTPVLATAAPIRNEQGDIQGGIVVWQDISLRKKAEQSLQQSRRNLLELKEQLENKNRELESIIGIVSHDLRSPLVSISGFSQEIRFSCQQAVKSLESPDQVHKAAEIVRKEIPEFLDFIQSSTAKMDALVRSLVKVARAGMAEIRPEPIDMNRLMAEASSAIGFEIKESQTDLQIEDLPGCFADRTQTNQIFTNLLDNSIKYLDPNRPGRIRVSGRIEGRRSVYCVQDNGIGIASQHLEHIFDLFSRLDRTKASGEGIGLAMVKRMVARNNGTIRVESEEGKGTCFCVSLPRFAEE
jgi:PAS domain S-box-containing protein